MDSNHVETLHASTERCDAGQLMKQVDYLAALPLFKEGLDATNAMILIINSCRQTVFANKALLRMVNIKKILNLCGKRAGEIIQCIHAAEGVDGCGTAEACRYCNAVNTILNTMETKEETTGVFSNINRLNGYENAINLSIHVAPLQIQEENFYVVSFTDNSDNIRKRMLERTFFHDIMNTAGALKGIVGLLKDDVPDIVKPELEFVEESFKYLVEEIQAQKYMMDAEDDQLVLEITAMETTDIFKSVSKLYEGHDITANKTIQLDSHCASKNIYTDQRILRRILGNMIKNALEATEERGQITLGCDTDRDQWIKLWVHNDQYMDVRVQNLVFHRSFSTKGDGRGLGTYSIKLFGEKFLRGKVGFLTNEEEGTTFYIKLPLNLRVDN